MECPSISNMEDTAVTCTCEREGATYYQRWMLNMEMSTSDVTIVINIMAMVYSMAATIGEDSHLGLLCCSGHWGPRLGPSYPWKGYGSKVPII